MAAAHSPSEMLALRFTLDDILAPTTRAVTAMPLVFVAVLGFYVFYNLFLHPLADLPGPLGARTGLFSWRTHHALKKDAGWAFTALHDRYGKVVRVGKNEATICDPEAINEIYRFGSPLYKTHFYSLFRGAEGPGLMATLGNHEHAAKRRAQAPAFALNYLLNLEEFVDSCANDLTDQLDSQINASGNKQTATVEMADLLQFLALDVVGELAFGETFGLCKAGKDTHDFLPALVAFNEGACLSGTQPALGAVLLWLHSKLNQAPEGMKVVTRMAQRVITGRVAHARSGGKSTGLDDRKDMLSKLIESKNPDGSPATDHQILTGAGAILAAGSDTTAITMRAMLRHIVGDPRIYTKAMEEIDAAVEDGVISFPVTYAQAQKLPFLQACLKETLRYHPAVNWTLPRVIPEGGATILGRFYPAGCEVSMNPYVVHRREEAYGKDAKVYRPERWLEGSDEQKKLMDRNMLAFGSGARICIGRNISLMEISKVMPMLLYRYNFRFTPRTATSPHESKLGLTAEGVASPEEPWDLISQWFAIQRNMYVDVSVRNEL